MKIIVGSDHGGFELKEKIVKFLEEQGYDFHDVGTYSQESCDYNDSASKVAKAVASKEYDRGITFCGTGIGSSIQVNKFKGIRGALVHDLFTAKATREHNDSNILTLGGRIIGDELAKAIVDVWLKTEFSNEERHKRRISKIGG